MFKKKKKKEYEDDDGRTVANMNVDGMPWYEENKEENDEKRRKMMELRLSHKEKFAMYMGAVTAFLPMLLVAAAAFTIVMILIAIWLG